MRWLVDASNVIGSRPDGWWRDREGATRRLIAALERFAEGSGEAVTVVLDAGPTELAGRAGGVEVAIAPRRGRDAADDEIVRRLEAAASAAEVTVVTSDRELARRARAFGATVEGARTFRDRLQAPFIEGSADLTIDQLAQRTGMTVRNVRAHQSRGLLPPPEVRGRTGYYGAEHVTRIELIRELQDDGFNLELIRRLIESAGSSSAALRFTRALRAPYGEEEPEIVTAEELAERWGSTDPKLAKRAQELGIMRPLGDGRYEEVSPTLGRVSSELAELGVSARQALEVAGSLRRHADSVARAYMKLFVEAVWKPFEAEGRPEERWPEISEALERLRPLAAESLLAMFALAMDDATEKTFGRQLERLPDPAKR